MTPGPRDPVGKGRSNESRRPVPVHPRVHGLDAARVRPCRYGVPWTVFGSGSRVPTGHRVFDEWVHSRMVSPPVVSLLCVRNPITRCASVDVRGVHPCRVVRRARLPAQSRDPGARHPSVPGVSSSRVRMGPTCLWGGAHAVTGALGRSGSTGERSRVQDRRCAVLSAKETPTGETRVPGRVGPPFPTTRECS